MAVGVCECVTKVLVLGAELVDALVCEDQALA